MKAINKILTYIKYNKKIFINLILLIIVIIGIVFFLKNISNEKLNVNLTKN